MYFPVNPLKCISEGRLSLSLSLSLLRDGPFVRVLLAAALESAGGCGDGAVVVTFGALLPGAVSLSLSLPLTLVARIAISLTRASYPAPFRRPYKLRLPPALRLRTARPQLTHSP